MKKRFLSLLLALAAGLIVVCPLCVCAAGLDTDADASMTLYYQKDGEAFPGLNIAIHRVAQALPDGSFALVAPFSSYPISIHGITRQEQWTAVTDTLVSCVAAQQVPPSREMQTDQDGIARFDALQTGLYFVCGAVAEGAYAQYEFRPFMIYVPTPQPDGTYDYHVEARPKCAGVLPKTHYTVTKLWQDAGDSAARPQEILVDIYRDGILVDTQTLSAGNNWSYTWQAVGEGTEHWTVAERTVPEGYTVSVQQNGSVFSIINTDRESAFEAPPQTGDAAMTSLWGAALCLSGAVLLALRCYDRRRG